MIMKVLLFCLKWLGYCWLGFIVLIIIMFAINTYFEYKRKRDNRCINCINYDSGDTEACKGCKYYKDKEYLDNINRER